MRDIQYKPRCIRVDDETWRMMQEERSESKESWNKYLLKKLFNRDKPYAKSTRKT